MSGSATIDFGVIWKRATDVFVLGSDSLHGPEHWRRVEAFGLRLAGETGADRVVLRLFAILHDSQRQDEWIDPGHGRRGAAFARRLRGEAFQLDDERFALLEEAIALHADGEVTENPTIGTCWDADRLDLLRVGITPSSDLLNTEAARKLAPEIGDGAPFGERRWQL